MKLRVFNLQFNHSFGQGRDSILAAIDLALFPLSQVSVSTPTVLYPPRCDRYPRRTADRGASKMCFLPSKTTTKKKKKRACAYTHRNMPREELQKENTLTRYLHSIRLRVQAVQAGRAPSHLVFLRRQSSQACKDTCRSADVTSGMALKVDNHGTHDRDSTTLSEYSSDADTRRCFGGF